jgi:hypothetical protein
METLKKLAKIENIAISIVFAILTGLVIYNILTHGITSTASFEF